MIRAVRIRELADRDGVRPEEVEKEYLQYAFLHSWAEETGGLVFRGGTMIHIAHGHPRYSEDLDFVRLHTVEEALGALQAAIDDVARWGLDAHADEPQVRDRGTIVCDIRFRGPLHAETGQMNRIKLQAGSTDDTLLPPEDSIIRQRFDDIPLFVIPTQDLRETAAEKVRALVERDQARDLYDLHHLIARGIAPDPDHVAAKLRWRPGEPPRRLRPHDRIEYERDLELWIPRRAHVPWRTAWDTVRKTLAGVRALDIGKP